MRQVITAASRVTGRPIKVMTTARRAGDPAILIASSERIKRELGWRPLHPSLDDIIGSAWAWMDGPAAKVLPHATRSEG